ncbi:MAG: 1-acyl-sn-glycerol-3-phosphate acyltransferase [Cyclobacteriaceae bacterium]|nr:MAG: 1-acyl-sn-glycerol-3-phosphate acyltransferase [Cyclobacteriaceae bacterium]
MRLLRFLYTCYAVTLFGLTFLPFFLLLLIPIVWRKQHKLVGIFNRWWARLLFLLCGMPVKLEWRFMRNPRQQYIFCPNHFSYLDIPVMGLNPHNTIFVGKNDMEKIPLFGFMYRKLHITVNRKRLKSRFETFVKSCRAVDEGKSLVIFPEGGIISEYEPVMAPLKDGAFRVAIEKQIPLVPVTLPYNHLILPAHTFLLRWGKVKAIFHEPIPTHGLTLNDLDRLKEQMYNIIQSELNRHYADYTRKN